MDQILTEQYLNEVETWNKLSPHRWCLIVTRARALLAQRDALKAERDEAIRKQMKANEELTGCRHALGGYAGPTDGISEEVKKVVAELEGCRKNMRDVKMLLLPESEGSNVPHTVIVERVKTLLSEAADRDFYAKQASEADDTIKRVVAERDTLAARVKELSADLFAANAALTAANKECDRTRGLLTHEFHAPKGIGKMPLHEAVQSMLGTLRGERDVAQRQLYMRQPANGPDPTGSKASEEIANNMLSAYNTAHEDGIRAGVSFVRRVLMDVGPVGTMTRVDKELDKLLRGATPMTHDAYATFDGNGRLDCLFHKDGPMPPEAEFVIVVRKNRPSLRLPDPDPRDAEIRALKYELARVRGVREAIPGEGDLHVFSFLTKIREVLGCNKFGYDLVDAIKAMKEELEKTKKEAAFGRASLEHAKALGIDTNKELGQQYRALRRDAEAWRASRSGGASGGNVQHLGVCFPAGGSPVMIPASMSCDPNRVFDYTAGYIAGKGAK